MSEVIHVRGEGGAVIPMTLPLHKSVQQRVSKGDIVRVNEDGSPWTGTEGAAPPASRRKPAAKQPAAE